MCASDVLIAVRAVSSVVSSLCQVLTRVSLTLALPQEVGAVPHTTGRAVRQSEEGPAVRKEGLWLIPRLPGSQVDINHCDFCSAVCDLRRFIPARFWHFSFFPWVFKYHCSVPKYCLFT